MHDIFCNVIITIARMSINLLLYLVLIMNIGVVVSVVRSTLTM